MGVLLVEHELGIRQVVRDQLRTTGWTEDPQRSCITVMFERMPQLAIYTTAERNGTLTDVAYILAYLATSVDLDDDELVSDFIGWLTTVVHSRGVPPSVLDRLLEIIGEVVAGSGMHQAARLCDSNRRLATHL